MIGKIFINIKTAMKDPSLLPLYAKWITAGGSGQKKAMELNGTKIAGFPSFSSYLGAWRNRPNEVERAFMATSLCAGATVFDVGANYGIMAMTMGQLCGKEGQVFAFEPIPDTFSALDVNLQRNGFEWINRIESAVGAASGTIGFTNSSDPATNRISNESDLVVTIDTLDKICTRLGVAHIDFLKIDVEGAELDVLEGAKGLLQRHCIRAGMIEVCPGTLARFGKTPEMIYDTFTRHDYLLSWIETPGVRLNRDAFQNLPADFLGNAAFRTNPRGILA